MTEALTVSSEVEVAVDPDTAFHAFTEEMDLWWVRGPINFWSDAGRVVEVRCEPGVGGRIVEVLDDPASGEVFERARLTQWEPGVRLAWESDLDDVQTEVRFAPIDGGTRVTVEHVIPAGGTGQGWYRVESCRAELVRRVVREARPGAARADRHRSAVARRVLRAPGRRGAMARRRVRVRVRRAIFPRDPTRSPRVTTATRGSSSGSATRCSTSSSSTGNGAWSVPTHVPWVYVDDLEAHFAHAKGNGATIVEEIHAYPGSTVYVADDLEGNRWTFSQARPTMR